MFRSGKTCRLIALCIERYNAKKFGRNDGDGSSARNSSAQKPVFQANLQIRVVVFENMYGR
jgi:hypothetical protein